MLKILVIVDHYLPSYKAGGPIRSISNTVESLGDEFEFKIVTSDRDLGDSKPFNNIPSGRWTAVGKAKVLYLSPRERRLGAWRHLLYSEPYDLLYLNSFFSTLTVMTLMLRKIGKIPERPILIAARGEMGQGALSIKRLKKKFYLFLTKLAGFYDGVKWHASSEYEFDDFRFTLGISRKSAYISTAPIFVAPDLPRRLETRMGKSTINAKECGSVRIVFLSRIARKKNLDMALQLLRQVKGRIEFDIYGPQEDQRYWRECQQIIDALPSNICAKYRGMVHPDDVENVFSQYHLFLFPTRNGNFGHVILEAFCAGCLVLTSDATAWRGLEAKRLGWDMPLSNRKGFLEKLDEMIAMGGAEYEERSLLARDFGYSFANNPELVDASRRMFLAVMNGTK